VISKKAIALCAAAGVAVSGFALVTPANADPVAESYSIVGSDTLEDVVGALIQGTSITGAPVRSLVNNASSGSFDATGTPYIIAKSGGKRFGRPNGSGDGRTALKASIDGTTTFTASAQLRADNAAPFTVSLPQVPGTTIPGEVDLARASSSGTVLASGNMVQIPFGRDALGYVYNTQSNCADLADLTTTELKTIFEGGDITKCSHVVRALTPQVGSGTGKDWAGKIGADVNNITASVNGSATVKLTSATATANGTSVKYVLSAKPSTATLKVGNTVTFSGFASDAFNGSFTVSAVSAVSADSTVTPAIVQDYSVTVANAAATGTSTATTATNVVYTVTGSGLNAWGQEHDASNLATFTVMPMAATRWIAMNTGASYPKIKTDGATPPAYVIAMGSIGGVAPVTGTGTNMAPNSTYYAGSYGRDTYIVAEYSRVTVGGSNYDKNLAALVDPTKSTSLTNTDTGSASKAGSVKAKFGFLAPSTTDRVRISG
jgi:hypothetical protein